MREPSEEILDKLEEIKKRMEESNNEKLDKLEDVRKRLIEMSRQSDLALSYGFFFGSITVIAVGFAISSLLLQGLGVGVLVIAIISFRCPFWRSRIGRIRK